MPATSPLETDARRHGAMRQMVVWSVPAALVVALAVALVAGLLVGATAGWSALLGGVLSLLVFAAGLLAIRAVLAGPAALSMAGAFAVLVAQLVLTAVVLAVVFSQGWADVVPLAVGFLLAGLVFQVGVIVGYLRSRQLVAPGSPVDTRDGGQP
ncbi:hypothetical protein [Ornithinicoccus halotolerans]|uniref:hypothetical protein n=1 Tax=Ornithinicoccus halotolerans TaxID=1748220 RepID=UPI001295D9BE|nr:hypothetical protein [Ornithinicoccus halotolerans]